MKVLITGSNGLLGPYLVEAFFLQDYDIVLTTKGECDLTNRADVKELLLYNPDVIVHAAAETDIDLCEKEPIKALAVNRNTTYHLIGLMSPQAKFVYISTDMVYPDIRGPHLERDTGPVNMYGRSKLAGENVAARNARHLICRTNFFGASRTSGKQSFSDWVIQSLQDGSAPLFYNDVLWNPLHMETLCSLIVDLVEKDVVGTYNLGSGTIVSKAAFAGAVAERVGLLKAFNKAAIGPAHFAVKRPKDLSLDCTKLAEKGWLMPALEEEIKKLWKAKL